jgi:benzil reductase ((S)-benzoin forming)
MHGMNTVELTVLTGASRGLGLALARQILGRAAPQILLTLQRQPGVGLAALAHERGHRLIELRADLAEPLAAVEVLIGALAALEVTVIDRASLINNAGLLSTPGPAADTEMTELVQALRVGLEAPLLLSAAFLKRTRDWPARQRRGVRVLNVSSGLGRYAMAGSAAYCGAKAGLDHASRALALEEALLPHPARIVSLAPGVIATGMQVQLRSQSAERFPAGRRFQDLHAADQLATPEDAAARVLAWLERADFGDAVVADVRDA